jgi:hypothetical protein
VLGFAQAEMLFISATIGSKRPLCFHPARATSISSRTSRADETSCWVAEELLLHTYIHTYCSNDRRRIVVAMDMGLSSILNNHNGLMIKAGAKVP